MGLIIAVMYRSGVVSAHLAGIHSSSAKDACTDHPWSHVHAVDTGVRAGGLRYDLDLSLPQFVSHEAWQGKNLQKEKEKRSCRT